MKSIELLQYLNIDYVTEGHKHCRPGWANMSCPFCTGNPGMHLGFDLENAFFRCWRCGWHPMVETLHKLTGIPFQEIKQTIRQFGGSSKKVRTHKELVRMKGFRFPSNTSTMTTPHRKYLAKRNFDPDKVIHEWNLLSTGIVSSLDDADYGNRILIPVYWNGERVSFQCRAVSGKEPKYKACPKDRELVFHKHILYGKQAEWKDAGICVEGVTDVWRFGPRAFAVFGIEFKMEQVRQMVKNFKKVVVCFDDDPQAVRQSHELVGLLHEAGVSARRHPIVGDPGGMDQAEADYLVKSLIK